MKTDDVDAIVLSACVQMPSLPAIAQVEALTGKPVVTAAVATTYAMLGALGLEQVVPGAGALLSGRYSRRRWDEQYLSLRLPRSRQRNSPPPLALWRKGSKLLVVPGITSPAVTWASWRRLSHNTLTFMFSILRGRGEFVGS